MTMNVDGYEELAAALNMAYEQAARGKGKERHANSKPFVDQPIFAISRMVGLGGLSYQVCKKAQEATGMADRGDANSAIAEFLGAIVYSAAAINLIAEMGDDDIFSDYLRDFKPEFSGDQLMKEIHSLNTTLCLFKPKDGEPYYREIESLDQFIIHGEKLFERDGLTHNYYEISGWKFDSRKGATHKTTLVFANGNTVDVLVNPDMNYVQHEGRPFERSEDENCFYEIEHGSVPFNSTRTSYVE